MISRGEPSLDDIIEMREYGWTSTKSKDEWFMPLRWGHFYRRVLVQGEDGKIVSSRVQCGLPLSEAWAFHCLFAFRPETPKQGFFGKRRFPDWEP